MYLGGKTNVLVGIFVVTIIFVIWFNSLIVFKLKDVELELHEKGHSKWNLMFAFYGSKFLFKNFFGKSSIVLILWCWHLSIGGLLGSGQ
jgi:hypothetical protein